ncbi:hypothetical protein [Mycobacterium sp.]|uniref:hypothetical protein n=1 Tax=Mycobacterium sp. TaxID=1785 RepID=UPI002639E13B|nr:hypothetical protein [Mycobacterium sp.]
MLREAVEVIYDRAERLRQSGDRLLMPSVADPLIVIVVDEIAALTGYGIDRKKAAQIERLLGLILTKGERSPSPSWRAAKTQQGDPVAATIRIALRLTESSQVSMVLGPGARDAGAICEGIDPATPGVGYVMVDGRAEALRVRAFHVTDADITRLAAAYVPLAQR